MLAVAAPAMAQTSTPAAAPAPAPAAQPAAHRYPVETTSIDTLVQNAATRPLVERHFPGLAQHPYYDMIKTMSLRAVQPYSSGLVTDEKLAALQADLDALPAQ
jgi:hypothetical protein